MDIENHKLEWLEFDLLKNSPGILSAVFLRHGGTSEGEYSSLNMSNAVGDNPDSVKFNRELIRRSLNLSDLVFAHPQHGTDIKRITSENMDESHLVDAFYTQEKDIGLAITHEDCQATIFYDPENQAIGIVHAGWKGNVQNIYRKMVDTLASDIHSKPENLIVCISPSLGPDHAEFKLYKKEFPKELWAFEVENKHFDLWAMSKNQLIASGIPEKNIEIAEVCTYCNPKDYYSFRREKKTGRHATVVALKP